MLRASTRTKIIRTHSPGYRIAQQLGFRGGYHGACSNNKLLTIGSAHNRTISIGEESMQFPHLFRQHRTLENLRPLPSQPRRFYHSSGSRWAGSAAATAASSKDSVGDFDEKSVDDDDDDISQAAEQFVEHLDSGPGSLLGDLDPQDSEWLFEKTRRPPLDNKSMAEKIRSYRENPYQPPDTEDLEAIQEWFECQAQQETVRKYQTILDDARSRKEYSSISMVQRQVLEWFPLLRDEFAEIQKAFLLREASRMKNGDTDSGNNNDDDDDKYEPLKLMSFGEITGPYLCLLPPEKVALITAHEVIMMCLHKGGGVPFVKIVHRLGQAVEEEVIIQRQLFKRYKERQEYWEKIRCEEEGEEEEPLIEEEVEEVEEEPPQEQNETEGDSHNNSSSGSAEDGGETTFVDNDSGDQSPWMYGAGHLKDYLASVSADKTHTRTRKKIANAINRARRTMDSDDWPAKDKVRVGDAMLFVLMKHAKIKIGNGHEEPAFSHGKISVQKGSRDAPWKIWKGITMNETFQKQILEDDIESFYSTSDRQKPMVVKPRPWTSHEEGGYLLLKTELMRFHGCNVQAEALQHADLSILLDGLNVLGATPWKINKEMLKIAQKCWDENQPLGDIPSRTDFVVPPKPEPPKQTKDFLKKGDPGHDELMKEYFDYHALNKRHRRIQQKNYDLTGLRCSAILKLEQAKTFQAFDRIYFPYNIDFRGRAYPVPPHLSNTGSDLCRGMLIFADGKPLGPKGLFWLKVHLANMAGMDKATFDARAKWTEDRLGKVRESAETPFAGERWWMGLDEPYQGLATCKEIIKAIDSGEPESYVCCLPVHMDGSCNGLQHYAALGRDVGGGTAVNLCAVDEPQDVYHGVMKEVIKRVAEEAKRGLDFDTSDLRKLNAQQKKRLRANRSAKMVDGFIDRGVVKRPVMTSVYGVTHIGARQQIEEKLEEKLKAAGIDIDEKEREIFDASNYVAKVTMEAIGDLFTGANETMTWLTKCAQLVARHGYPVAWISPIGIPAIQPYRQTKKSEVTTIHQIVSVAQRIDDNAIHKRRQVSAFPPNYVHSLDSSHMLLTALEMDRRGLTFSAVHDSFWTHPCDVDEMNVVLRDVFVDLYNKPLLSELKQTFEMRYPDVEFPDLPQQGALDLNEVKRAPYFFQ